MGWTSAGPDADPARAKGNAMPASDIWKWSAVETAAAIRSGRASSEEVMAAHVARLHAANPAQAAGDELGTLHGVPVTIKINVDVEGQANSNGVPGLANVIAPGDAPI